MSLDDLLAAARRQKWIVLLGALLGLGTGLAVALATPRQYTASTSILIDPSNLGGADEGKAAMVSERGLDSGSIDSQIEVLRSDRIALAVAEKLNLAGDQRFLVETPSLIGRLETALHGLLPIGAPADKEADLTPEALALLERANLVGKLHEKSWISRAGDTYVLHIDFTSPYPDLAAAVSNAFADAYLQDQITARFDAARQAGSWLEQRLTEIKQQAFDTDLAAQRFRSDNGLLDVGDTPLYQQQLIDANRQLTDATARRVEAEARWRLLQQAAESGDPAATVSQLLESAVINDLRIKFNTTSKRLSEVDSDLGGDHPQTVRLQAELDEYKRLISEETARIAATYGSEYQIDRSSEELFKTYLDDLEKTAAARNSAEVKLRELEREAETYRDLYQTYLARYQDALQQESFPLAGARIITAATQPIEPSYPRKGLIAAIGLLAGLGAGVGLGGLRELRERGFRNGDRLRNDLQLDYLGALPLNPAPVTRAAPHSAAAAPRIGGTDGIALPPVLRQGIDEPLGVFVETLRNARAAIDRRIGADRVPKIIGVVSVLPGEGKTTTATNFALMLARSGARTLLVDGDFRAAGLSRMLAPGIRRGLIEALRDGASLKDFYLREPETGLSVLPTVLHEGVNDVRLILSPAVMETLVRQTSRAFDYVVVDLPPLGLVGDTHALTSYFDGYLLVVEWGRTPRKLIASVVSQSPDLHEKVVGAILNKVRLDKMRLYSDYGSKDFYHSGYPEYHR